MCWFSVGDVTVLSVLNEFKEDLASPDNGKGDALIGVKQPYDNTALRTQHDKNAETLSILDFYIPNQPDWKLAFKNAARVSADIESLYLFQLEFICFLIQFLYMTMAMGHEPNQIFNHIIKVMGLNLSGNAAKQLCEKQQLAQKT